MDLGAELRTARERAGVSLPELAARTRIPLKSLRALEENDFAKLPPELFTRSFIRNYAQEVGVDPAAAIEEYRAMTASIADSAHASDEGTDADDEVEPDSPESRPVWGYALIAAALLIGLISVNRYVASGSSDAIAASVAGPAAAAKVVQPVAAAESVQPVATTGTEIRVEMRAQGPCWVRAVVDGQFAFARLLQPGETQNVTGQRDIVVRVGDPAAFSYSINGLPGEPLGAAAVPITVRFGADGRPERVS